MEFLVGPFQDGNKVEQPLDEQRQPTAAPRFVLYPFAV